MTFEYKFIYNVKIEADSEDEAEEKADALFCSLYDVDDVEDTEILDTSDYYVR